MKFLPARVHEILDYIVGLALILAPYIFQFNDVGGAANAVPQIIGIASILMGLSTRGYRFSPLKLIPLSAHMIIDFVAGVLLAVSPWLFGFSDQGTNAWLPHLVVGIALIIVSLATQTAVASTREE